MLQAELNDLVKRNAQPPAASNSAQNPTTYSYVYLRIQPFITPLSLPTLEGATSTDEKSPSTEETTLQFLLYLSDPSHNLAHSTVTQAVPGRWLALWDEYDWVEDLVVESIRVGVEVIGQEYIVSRMGWDKKTVDSGAAEPASEAVDTKTS